MADTNDDSTTTISVQEIKTSLIDFVLQRCPEIRNAVDKHREAAENGNPNRQ